jgi:hypothetical protein
MNNFRVSPIAIYPFDIYIALKISILSRGVNMECSNKRKCTRSQVWKNTKATLKMIDQADYGSRRTISINGDVTDIGAKGMFLSSFEYIPVPGKAEITINFDSDLSDCSLMVKGETVRETKKGVGIKFTSIDMTKLQKCIINKINKKTNKNMPR